MTVDVDKLVGRLPYYVIVRKLSKTYLLNFYTFIGS